MTAPISPGIRWALQWIRGAVRFAAQWRVPLVCLLACVICAAGSAAAVQLGTGPEGEQPGGWLGQTIARYGLWAGLVATFIGGLALNLTPCVYPMIPVTLAFFSGQASGSGKRTLLLALSYVIGISLTYAVLGLFAARTGALMGSLLQRPLVVVAMAILLVGLSLSLFGLYELRPPHAVMQRVGRASSGLLGAFVMGLVVGIVAAPCIGPFVLGLLLLASRLADPATGFLLFFTLGIGMGAPYILLGLAADRISHLPKAGAWLVWVKQVLGVVLLGLALYVIKPLLVPRLFWGALAALLTGAGVALGWMGRSAAAERRASFVWLRRAVGVLLIVLAGAVLWPRPEPAGAVVWVPYTEAAFERAQRAHQPMLIDIYADWCLPCVELDHVTFRHPDVVAALTRVVTLRVDATREVSPEAERLFARYQVFGVPTVLLFDRRGAERKELRIAGFVPPEALLGRLPHLE